MTYRNRKLLDVAHEAPCMFLVVDVCESEVHPSVPAHSNRQRHGRGVGHKSADVYAPAACPPCHYWYDYGPASRAEKDEAFMAALERWMLWIFENEKVRVA